MATAGPIVAGSTYKWSPTFIKDGVIYDLTGATIIVSFLPPTGSAQTFSMSILSASAGTATYTNLTTLFTNALAGQWSRSYRVTLSGVVLESKEIAFQVYRSIAGS